MFSRYSHGFLLRSKLFVSDSLKKKLFNPLYITSSPQNIIYAMYNKHRKAIPTWINKYLFRYMSTLCTSKSHGFRESSPKLLNFLKIYLCSFDQWIWKQINICSRRMSHCITTHFSCFPSTLVKLYNNLKLFRNWFS